MDPAALLVGGLAAGLAAGTASCTAVQGGLLIGLVGPSRHRTATPSCRHPAHIESGSPHRTDTGHKAGTGPATADRALSGGSRRDLTVVGVFLSARLLSHLAAGALLGLVGSAVQIGPRARAVFLVAAGIAVLAFAVRLLLADRRPSGCAAHGSGDHSAHGSAQGQTDGSAHRSAHGSAHGFACVTRGAAKPGEPAGILRATALGLATILVPCGVTISMEVVAVSTGSALGGAAVLGGFAIGTVPAFAALGLLLRRVAGRRPGALTMLAGVAALAAGIFTVGSGLRLGGWLPDLGPAAASATFARQGPDGVQRLTIWATAGGFRPGVVRAVAGRATEIVFRSHDNRGCTRALSIDGRDLVLPVTGEQSVRLAPREPGRLRYACGMGMYVGFISFEKIPASQRTLK
ncbi:sulfite exporter TauE/SafE family protein [Sphaerimonospora sp. CA-214678]|uniref:urease accessory protein UreH domain-containing protein n=1 Tax=Sphaerimonospora sp. CA-214678 TaxID=3240029 RepID=UPI003D8CD677